MKYSKANPLLEFDIYQDCDNSWMFFISILRWSFSIELLSSEKLESAEDCGYSDSSGNKLSSFHEEEEAHEEWLKQWERSTEGREFPYGEEDFEVNDIPEEEETFHPLEGLYYSHNSNQFVEVAKNGEGFSISYEVGFGGVPFSEEFVSQSAVEYHTNDKSWELIAQP